VIFKYLILFAIIYGIYSFSIKDRLSEKRDDTLIRDSKEENDDYIEYEEIE